MPVPPEATARPRTLVIGCGALARELLEITRQPGFEHVEVTCLAADLHFRPERIPDAVRRKIRSTRASYDQIFVAYADCGTGGLLDPVLAEEGVERLGGAHCYEFYAGSAAFERLMDEELGTFFLTDFLARHFDSLVVRALGIDRHPELAATYFANYHRLVYLAQHDDADLDRRSRDAAERLGLAYERRFTGLGDLATGLAPLGIPA
ncbi:MAG: DUF1638 domain-containing protein [Chloroflexota bacterium]